MVGQNKGPSFGEGLLEGLREAVAWKRGEVVLPESAFPLCAFTKSMPKRIKTEETIHTKTAKLKDA